MTYPSNIAKALSLPLESADQRPEEFKQFWGKHREIFVEAVHALIAPGRKPEMAPAWVRDDVSLVCHDIALSAWVTAAPQSSGLPGRVVHVAAPQCVRCVMRHPISGACCGVYRKDVK